MDLAPSGPVVRMDGFDRKSLDVAGNHTVLYAIGSGPPLVFLHGAGTFTGFEAVKTWAAARTVIVPYHPGFGESADDPSFDSIDDYVLHYIDLFDRLGLARLDLVGFSLGGWIAAEFAVRQPQRLEKLVLVAPAGLVIDEHPAPDLFQIAQPDLPAYLAHDPAVALRYFPQGPDPAFEALVAREMTAVGRILAHQPQGNPKLARWLYRIDIPTLILWGDRDRIRPFAQGTVWQKLLPQGRLERTPETGHLLFEERPELAGLVIDFLGRAGRNHDGRI
jgi:pimeloyl-ACP methyl ester carboxylesterase